MLPIHPPEVWGCGCTYETSASFRDAEHGTREGMYAYVYREPRPEIFFKGTARVCVGPRTAHRHPRRFQVHGARAGTGGDPGQQAAGSRATRWPTTFRRGISSARTRCTCRSRRSTTAAARSAR